MKHKSSKEVNLAEDYSRKSPRRKRKHKKVSRSISKVQDSSVAQEDGIAEP